MKNGVLIMPSLVPVNGVIQSITTLDNNCCMQQVTVRNSDGIQNFIISPDTYVINEVRNNYFSWRSLRRNTSGRILHIDLKFGNTV